MQGTSLLLCFFDNWKIGLARKGTRLYIVEGHGKIVYSLFDSVLLDYTAILAGTNSLILWWHCFQHCHCLITVVNGLILPSTCLLVIILTADLYSFIFFFFYRWTFLQHSQQVDQAARWWIVYLDWIGLSSVPNILSTRTRFWPRWRWRWRWRTKYLTITNVRIDNDNNSNNLLDWNLIMKNDSMLGCWPIFMMMVVMDYWNIDKVSDGRYDLLDLIRLVCILLNKGTLDDVIVQIKKRGYRKWLVINTECIVFVRTSLNQKATMYYM